MNERESIQITELKEELKAIKNKFKEIRNIAYDNILENKCDNCDGVGLDECQDVDCSYYQMNKIFDILEHNNFKPKEKKRRLECKVYVDVSEAIDDNEAVRFMLNSLEFDDMEIVRVDLIDEVQL